MAMYVIADLHLHPQGKALQQAFYAFVSKLHAEDELYILGDLFNFFVGLDKHNAAQKLVKDTLAEAKHLGVKAYFVRGNRDFLMTAKDAAWLNMELLPDVVLRSFGPEHVPVVLSHGDMFCTNDQAYMRYFKQVHNPCLQGIFRSLPLFIRRKIANSIREQSAQTDRSIKGREFYGVVDRTMDEYAHKLCEAQEHCCLPVPALVHGHIHEFGEHTGLKNVQKRYALGAWGDKFSYFKLSLPQDSGGERTKTDTINVSSQITPVSLSTMRVDVQASNVNCRDISSISSMCGISSMSSGCLSNGECGKQIFKNGYSMPGQHFDLSLPLGSAIPNYAITFVERELEYLLRPETHL